MLTIVTNYPYLVPRLQPKPPSPVLTRLFHLILSDRWRPLIKPAGCCTIEALTSRSLPNLDNGVSLHHSLLHTLRTCVDKSSKWGVCQKAGTVIQGQRPVPRKLRGVSIADYANNSVQLRSGLATNAPSVTLQSLFLNPYTLESTYLTLACIYLLGVQVPLLPIDFWLSLARANLF
jgi:hypothetical protein